MAAFCGKHAPTTGKPCEWRVDRQPCIWHDPAVRKAREDRVARSKERVRAGAAPGPIASHDLRGLSWWLIREVVGGNIEPRAAAVAVSAARILHALGPEGASEDEALQEAVLRGMVMNGVPPSTPEDWDLAAQVFQPGALDAIRRWRPLGERHHADIDQPRILGNLARHQAQPPRVVHHED